MILLPFILFFIGWVVVKFIFHYKWYWILVFSGASLLLSLLVVGIDYTAQTTDTEVWSGRVIDWEHKEEWDE